MEGALLTATANSVSARFAALAAVIGLLLGGAAFWGANKEALGLFHDDGVYTVVAKSLYQGDGYRIISLPSGPPQTKYPFLYSYLLSWVWAVKPVFPDNIIFLKGLNILILVAIFIISVAYYRRRCPASRLAALLFGTIICTNPIIFTFTDYVVSDLLLVLLTLVALYLTYSSSNFGGGSNKTATLALVTGLACLTRLAAAPLVFAGAVQAFVARSWRGVVNFVGLTLLIGLPWVLWVSFGPSVPSDSLFAYYGAYDFAGVKIAGAVGPWFDRHWLVIAGNARYLIGSFDLLYLLQLLPGFGIVVAVFSAVGVLDLLRREEVFNWVFFCRPWRC
jgi:4-amino-4-deoxy-L-arabinose transferase-like glycosyltransferase